MVELAFRNMDASPEDPVESWPYEAVVTAIERGYLSQWSRIAAAVRRRPWGAVARDVEHYAGYGADDGVLSLLLEAISRARATAEAAERDEVASRVRRALVQSGMTADRFAREIGTSPARLSTYRSGKVIPSASMLVRIERVARQAADSPA